MQNTSENFILDESDMTVVKLVIARNGRTLEKMVDEYKRILSQIRFSAILEGKVADSLNDFIAQANVLDNHIQTLSERYGKICDGLVEEVDRRDRYLY